MKYADSLYPLQYEFQMLKWYGAVIFIDVIHKHGLSKFPLSEIARMCGAVVVGKNTTYTVREYMSDLLSRSSRLSPSEKAWVETMFFIFAERIGGMRENIH